MYSSLEKLTTICMQPMSGQQLSITTSDPYEAARWMLRTVLEAGLARSLNPVNPIRVIDVYPPDEKYVATWIEALRHTALQ